MQGKKEEEDMENKEEEEELEEGDKKDKNLRWREVTRATTKQRERRKDQCFCTRLPDPWRRYALITQCSPDEAEGQGEADEGPVPLVVLPHSGHAHEDEDQGLADTA